MQLHKYGIPVSPVINNTNSPSSKAAKKINKIYNT